MMGILRGRGKAVFEGRRAVTECVDQQKKRYRPGSLLYLFSRLLTLSRSLIQQDKIKANDGCTQGGRGARIVIGAAKEKRRMVGVLAAVPIGP